MNQDLNFTPEVFGWGAGIFFIGYFLFEVPSNVILTRVGARSLDLPDHGDVGRDLGRERFRARPR